MKNTYKVYFGERSCIVCAWSANIAIALAQIEMEKEGYSSICTNIEVLNID